MLLVLVLSSLAVLRVSGWSERRATSNSVVALDAELMDELRLKFNQLAVGISEQVDESEFKLLKTYWSGLVPKHRLEAAADPGQLLATLLETDCISLSNVHQLISCFEELSLPGLSQRCLQYEKEARIVCSGTSLSDSPMHLPGVRPPPAPFSATVPVPETGGPGGAASLGAARRGPQNEPQESDETLLCGPWGPLASTPCRAPIESVNRPEELDEGTLFNVVSSVSSPARTREGICLWNAQVLQEFDLLPSFTAQEAWALHRVLGDTVAFPLPETKGERVKEVLSAVRERAVLRHLCEAMKTLNRQDVLSAMHAQSNLMSNLGPKLKEDTRVKDLPFSLWLPFTVALSVEKEDGSDWRILAERLGITATYRELWKQKSKNPAEDVLNSWKNKISEATVGNLFDHMISMGREDLADML
ncbi:uncharacterized protein LOC136753618 [Amia ocellicauda]|uniref:uncharacterized protein LOC136753618 n=1 Tax=Amia ocellicauda TaxID=2972642 RepID=UPI003463A36A